MCPTTFPGGCFYKAAESFLPLTASLGCCMAWQGLASAETGPEVLSPWSWLTSRGPPKEVVCQAPHLLLQGEAHMGMGDGLQV